MSEAPEMSLAKAQSIIAAQAAEIAVLKTERDEAIRCALMRRDRLDKAEADMKKMHDDMVLAKDIYYQAKQLFDTHVKGYRTKIAALQAKVEKLTESESRFKQCTIAYGAQWATQWSRNSNLPSGHMHQIHYDDLKSAGARMDSFTRAALTPEGE